MARDWSEPKTFAALEERLSLIAPDNTAPIPIACAQERDEVTGELVWLVDVHVRIPRVTEYDTQGAGKTLAGALRRAYLGLNAAPHFARMNAQLQAADPDGFATA